MLRAYPHAESIPHFRWESNNGTIGSIVGNVINNGTIGSIVSSSADLTPLEILCYNPDVRFSSLSPANSCGLCESFPWELQGGRLLVFHPHLSHKQLSLALARLSGVMRTAQNDNITTG